MLKTRVYFMAKTAELKKRVTYGTRTAVEDFARQVKTEGKKLTSKGGKRLTGKKGGKKIYRHEPSAPGMPPHRDTGTLSASIDYALIPATHSAIIGATVPYAKIHEHGGRLHPKRPFMRPALDRCKRNFPRLFRAAISGR